MIVTGRKIRELRHAKNWSQLDLANAANIDQATVSRIEAETKVPRTDTLVAIATALGVSPDVLLGTTTIVYPRERDPELSSIVSDRINTLTTEQLRELNILLSSEDGKAVLSALLRLQKQESLEKVRRLLEVLGEG
ncbi:MAG: helix-turn-helix transcriptional regulator [Gemmatimonadetes bacterium]|nr:helix-turn-helix transcriptional regulator [Gemmatimonadota bacterium]